MGKTILEQSLNQKVKKLKLRKSNEGKKELEIHYGAQIHTQKKSSLHVKVNFFQIKKKRQALRLQLDLKKLKDSNLLAA